MSASTLTIDPSGNNNKVTYTALDDGVEFNAISIAYLDPGAASQALSVTFDGKSVLVNLATDGASAISSIANDVRAAICGAKAKNTLTSNNTNPSVADTVKIGGTTYRFMDTTAQANDIFIGADADTTLGSLVKVLNGTATIAASGADAFTGTLNGHALVSAATVASHATVISARHPGTAYNGIVTTAPVNAGGTFSWAETTLGGASATQIGLNSIDTSLDANGNASNSPRRLMYLFSSANFAANDGTGACAAVAAAFFSGSTLQPTTGYADVATAQAAGWTFLGTTTSGAVVLPNPQNPHLATADHTIYQAQRGGLGECITADSAAHLLIAIKLHAAQLARKGKPILMRRWFDPALWAR